jgi:polysaccharide biosynthesis transport protein
VPPEETTTLELRDYLRVIRRRKWIIVFSVVLCVAASFAMSALQTDVYAATTTLLLEKSLVEQTFVPSDSGNAPGTVERERSNQVQVMNSPEVRATVQEKLGRAPSSVDFVTVGGSDVIAITSESEKPKLAARTANAYAETYLEVRRDTTVKALQDTSAQILSQIQAADAQLGAIDADLAVNPAAPTVNGRIVDPRMIQRQQVQADRDALADRYGDFLVGVAVAQGQSGARVLAPASTPAEPRNQSPISNILAGLAIGLVLGIALAFLREYLDDRIKTKDDLEAASGQTVIGLIPQLPDWKNREATQLVAVTQPRSPAAEAYRTVRTSVEFLGLDQPIGSLQVTSSMAGEGKTTTLANLAVTFARVGQRVIVLCCDLRRPRVHEFFGLTNRVGFTSLLLGDAPASEAIQPVRGELPIGIVASGPLAPNPAELLASKRAVSVIEELDSQCDLLLIDSPPVLPVTDAQVISGLVDGVILVGTSGSSTKRDVRRAVELLHQVDAPLIGAILNGVQSKHEAVYAYGDARYYLDAAVPVEQGPDGEGRNGKRGKRAAARAAARAER